MNKLLFNVEYVYVKLLDINSNLCSVAMLAIVLKLMGIMCT
jgi:hypothetical protein